MPSSCTGLPWRAVCLLAECWWPSMRYPILGDGWCAAGLAELMVRRPPHHVKRQSRKTETVKFVFLKKKNHHNRFINLLLKFYVEYGRSKKGSGEGTGRRKQIPLLASNVGILGGRRRTEQRNIKRRNSRLDHHNKRCGTGPGGHCPFTDREGKKLREGDGFTVVAQQVDDKVGIRTPVSRLLGNSDFKPP